MFIHPLYANLLSSLLAAWDAIYESVKKSD